MARQLREINWDVVEKLIEAGCNGIQIAAKFRLDDDTFYRRFQNQYNCRFADYKGRIAPAGEAEILAMQHAKALNNNAPGNTEMLKWVGKFRLGQKDSADRTTFSAEDDQKFTAIMQQLTTCQSAKSDLNIAESNISNEE